ncbi:DUF6089 family protein [Pedobacter steynii]|uniref:DUF6089 domain-containing protein n=1 Tax=Pedobacter steynii TaxID=430522 RepID=A0A1D7QHN7_9SPHI|nr:DUF6089 family protein [Pedobacter steynii]AOM78185.1 hypothetical protein BFS30_14010 [Pedobacter steynii]
MRYGTWIFCSLAISFIGFNANAQVMELGVVGGGAGYMGDLNQTKPLKISGMSAGAYVKMNLDPYWALGFHYNFGKIKANDLNSENEQFRDRGLNFKTSLNEISLQVDFNFFEYFAGGGTKKFTPYIFTGIGGVFFSPKGYYPHVPELGDKEYNLRFYRTEGQTEPYKNYALTVPYGVGFKVRLKENWGLFSQIGYRTIFTDYLDDVSGRYPDDNKLPADGLTGIKLSNPNTASSLSGTGLPGIQRGDFRKRDTYMFVGIGISYTFVSQKCYTF